MATVATGPVIAPIPLTAGQAEAILDQLALCSSRQHRDDKLCFTSAGISLETNSYWRTVSAWADWALKHPVSRELGDLPPLMERVKTALCSKEVATYKEISDLLKRIAEARKGLDELSANQYKLDPGKIGLINTAAQRLEETRLHFNPIIGPLLESERKAAAEDRLTELSRLRKENDEFKAKVQRMEAELVSLREVTTGIIGENPAKLDLKKIPRATLVVALGAISLAITEGSK